MNIDHWINKHLKLRFVLRKPQLQCQNRILNTMKSIVDKYGKYLLQLSHSQLLGEFQKINIREPQHMERSQYIQILLQSDRKKIQNRWSQLQFSQIDEKKRKDTIRKKKLNNLLKAEHIKMQNKIFDVHESLMNDFQQKWEQSQRKDKEPPQTVKQKQKRNPFDLKSIQLNKISPLNVVLNAQNQLKINPSRIKYEHQRNIDEIIDSFITYRSEEYLQSKEKELYKKMLPKEVQPEGNIIQNILMLYGIKKEEQFLKDLQDPLELLLTDHKMNEKNRNQNLHSFFNNFYERKRYYQSVICSLNSQQLYQLCTKVDEIQNSTLIGDFQKVSTLLDVSQIFRKNTQHFTSEYYQILLNHFKYSEEGIAKEIIVENMVFIEKWIHSILTLFCEWVQGCTIRKEEELKTIQKILVYKKLKRKIQKQMTLTLDNKQKRQLLTYLFEQEEQKDISIESIQNEYQSEQFNDKITDMILFFDPKFSENIAKNQITKYKHILEYFVELQKLQLSRDILNKVVKDNYLILENHYSFMDQNYVQLLVAFVSDFSISISQSDLGKIFPNLWKQYLKLCAKKDLKEDEGKYFLMITKIAIQFSKENQSIKKNIFSTKQYIVLLKKYIHILQTTKSDSLDKINIVAMLKEEVIPLSNKQGH